MEKREFRRSWIEDRWSKTRTSISSLIYIQVTFNLALKHLILGLLEREPLLLSQERTAERNVIPTTHHHRRDDQPTLKTSITLNRKSWPHKPQSQRAAPTDSSSALPVSLSKVNHPPAVARILQLTILIDDFRVLIAARQEARRRFDEHRREGIDTPMQINHAKEVAHILRHNIVQGVRASNDESATWGAYCCDCCCMAYLNLVI